jgi:hypothetical protein
MKNKTISFTTSRLIMCVMFSLIVLASCDSNSEATSKKDYSHTGSYRSGHKVGVSAQTTGGSSFCTGSMAEEQGACIDQISKDAWCQGYEDGYAGK